MACMAAFFHPARAYARPLAVLSQPKADQDPDHCR
jgi:hypothetical protein